MAGMKALACVTLVVLTGCCRTAPQRFVSIGDNVGFALDTQTGQTCYSLPKEQMKGADLQGFPFCVDLVAAK